MQDLSSSARDQNYAPCSFNHWTARKVLLLSLYAQLSYILHSHMLMTSSVNVVVAIIFILFCFQLLTCLRELSGKGSIVYDI